MKRLLSAMFLIATFCAAISDCQGQEVKVIEKLPNGEYRLSIDGVEQRTITVAHARQIEERKLELDRVTRERDLLNQKIDLKQREIDLLNRDRGLADLMIANANKRAESFELLYKGEHDLRLAAEKLMGRGRVSSFFEHPVVQIGVKLGWPALQTWLSSRR